MKEDIKLLLNVTDTSLDQLIDYYISSVTQAVLNYCNIDSLPVEAEYIVIDNVVNMIQEHETDGTIKRVSRGDYTVEYDTNGFEGSKISGMIVLKDYRLQLQRFRKFVWL